MKTRDFLGLFFLLRFYYLSLSPPFSLTLSFPLLSLFLSLSPSFSLTLPFPFLSLSSSPVKNKVK